MSFEVIVAALIVMLTSLSGVVFVGKVARDFLETRLPFLVSFSAGVFLVTAGAIALEVFHVVDSLLGGVALIVVGYILAYLLHFLLPETHHHHDPACKQKHTARKLIIGDALHNIADGVIIVTSFSVSVELGLLATVSIVIHEALQEISEFFVLRQAGYSVTKALAINFAVSSTILIGVGLGALALASPALEGLLLGVSAGFFLHVVAHDLLPRRLKLETASEFPKHVALVIVGALLMGVINLALSGSHSHGEAGHETSGKHHDETSVEYHHDEEEEEHGGFFDHWFHGH